jgi:lipopolysaccharide export system permease protein
LIINRYLIREISRPLAAILGILVALFGSYSAAGFLSEAVNGLLPTDTVIELIGLKVLISLEVLIPVSLYISVVMAFGKLYGDSEFTAMFALRITPARVMAAVVTLAGCLAILVAGLSLVVRPWAYDKLHQLSRRAELALNVNAMAAGTFYIGQHGNRVIFLAHRDGPNGPAQDVFVERWQADHTEIIHARLAYPESQSNPNSGSDVYLSDAHIYEIGHDDDHPDRIVGASALVVNPNGHDTTPPEYSSVAASTAQLAASSDTKDIAELQWRLSTPLSTLLLGMLGMPLSRAKPRQSRYEKFGTAILVYSGYYLLCTSARTWVQHGSVTAFPGIWWAPALLALFLAWSLFAPNLSFRRRRRRRRARA